MIQGFPEPSLDSPCGNRPLAGSIAVLTRYQTDLTDAEWRVVEPRICRSPARRAGPRESGQCAKSSKNAELSRPSGLIHSGNSQIGRSSSSSRHESRNCRQRHAEQIAVGLRRLSVTATRRRSMFGAPKSSLPPPTAVARPRSCGGPAKPSRWYGGGRRGSWRRALQG